MFWSQLFGSSVKAISDDERSQIEVAISHAEKMTSGEIKVIVEQKKSYPDIAQRAIALFHEHKLFETKLRNAVLIYVSLKNRAFYILGDQGIYEHLGKAYWEQLSERAIVKIKAEKSWVIGICHAIQFLGESFKSLYPIAEDDKNELDNRMEII